MPVSGYLEGDLFVVRIIKSLTTNPDNKWANSYELMARAAGDEIDLLAVASAIEGFEAALHHDVVRFERVIISTWEADSVPYNPANFISVPRSYTGAVGPVTDLLPLNECLSLARVPAHGRFGHLFYRGVLEEAEVGAPAGRQVLTDVEAIQEKVDAAVTSSELDLHFGEGGSPTPALVMVDKTGSVTRLVTAITVQGVSAVPQDHAWFNRT